MKFLQSLISDIIAVGISYVFYKINGFEFAIIVVIGLILSNIIKLNYKPKLKPPTKFYTTNTRQFKR